MPHPAFKARARLIIQHNGQNIIYITESENGTCAGWDQGGSTLLPLNLEPNWPPKH